MARSGAETELLKRAHKRRFEHTDIHGLLALLKSVESWLPTGYGSGSHLLHGFVPFSWSSL